MKVEGIRALDGLARRPLSSPRYVSKVAPIELIVMSARFGRSPRLFEKNFQQARVGRLKITFRGRGE